MNDFRISKKKGGILFLTYLGIVSLSGEVGGYPQALLKVVNLQGMLELSEILILVRSPPQCPNVNNIPYREKERRIQKENQKSECLTVPRLSALAY